MGSVLVFIDVPSLPLPRAARELLAIAGTLGTPEVAVPRPLADEAAAELGRFGAARIYEPAQELPDVLVAAKAAFLAEAVRAANPDAVLLGNSFEDREVAARTGIKLGSGVITDAVAVSPDLSVTKSVLAGSYTSTCRVETGTPVITVKANSVEPAEPGDGGTPERILQMCFLEGDPVESWQRIVDYAADIESSGAGRVTFASPFIPTEVGTDKYTDELW